MSNALAALKKKHAARKAAINLSDEKGMSGLHDAFVESMGSSLSTLGAISDLRNEEWRVTKIDVVTGFVQVDVAMPKRPMVEIDGMEFFGLLFKSAESIAPKVIASLASDALPGWLAAEGVKIQSGVDCAVAIAVTTAVTRKIMRAQGWVFIGKLGSWRSPAWLFPETMIPESAIQAHVEESFEYKGLLGAAGPEADPLDVVASNVQE